MKAATFQGTVENDQIRLPAGVRLPEKAKVYVVIPDVEIPSFAYIPLFNKPDVGFGSSQ